MLVNLTSDQQEIQRRREVSAEHGFEYTPQEDAKYLIEKGIYICSIPFNFPKKEFVDKLTAPYEPNLQAYAQYVDKYENRSTYGVADDIEQIKEYYKQHIEDTDEGFIINVTPVWQNKENAGKTGGWRWHKWGPYIGNLDSLCEYLDDEEFGDDFKYILTFEILKVT